MYVLFYLCRFFVCEAGSGRKPPWGELPSASCAAQGAGPGLPGGQAIMASATHYIHYMNAAVSLCFHMFCMSHILSVKVCLNVSSVVAA